MCFCFAVSPAGAAAAAAAAAAASGLPPQLRDLYGPGGPGAHHPLASLVTQQSRLLELSRFGLRHYDLAQHMLTQQGAVSKLLGECDINYDYITQNKYVECETPTVQKLIA